SWEGWEDSAVPPAELGAYLREFRDLLKRFGYRGALYGHFGDGCVHTRITFDIESHGGVRDYRRFVEEAADLVVSHGGSLSGEHGDGQSRAELLPKMFGGDLVAAFRQFKSIWDPEGRMNPHKVVDPYPLDSNLKLGTDYNPPVPKTQFSYPKDGGDFSHAALRCVGVGKCRDVHSGTMCPSYMVTHEEEHSTRGRTPSPARRSWADCSNARGASARGARCPRSRRSRSRTGTRSAARATSRASRSSSSRTRSTTSCTPKCSRPPWRCSRPPGGGS